MDVIVDFPITIIETKHVTKYRYYLYNLILNQEVTIIIDYFNNEGRNVFQTIRKLVGDEYTAWGADDSYIQNIVSAEVEKVKNQSIVIPVVDVSVADVSVADVSVADVSVADVSVADVSVADVSVVDVSGVDVSGVDVSVADVSVADVSVADVSGVDVSVADVSGTDVSVADVSGV